MKIAILGTRGIPARYGGFETFAEQLSSHLVDCGHAVTVFCETRGPDAPKQIGGVELRYVATPKAGPATTLLFDFACLWEARKDFDVVYMLGYASSVFCWIPRLFGREVWINMDGLEWARAKWGRVAKTYLRFSEMIATRTANRMIADAGAIKSYISRRYPNGGLCDVIPYGCEIIDEAPDKSCLSSLTLTPGDYYLVVCRFEPENHVREIIEGYCRSRSRKHLILVGDHKAPTPYVEALSNIDDPRIRFVGTIYEKTKLLALRFYARAYFHGHSVGGTNPSLLEAMGCGNAIVAHDNVFNREVLDANALFFKKPEELGRLVDCIEDLSIPLDGMRAGVLQRARDFYTWERVTTAYCELLECVRAGESSEINFSPEITRDGSVQTH